MTRARRTDERETVVLGPDLARVVDETIEVLGTQPIFQRQGALVDIVRDAEVRADGVIRPEGMPRIRMLPSARLKEMLSVAIDYKRRRQTEQGWQEVSVGAPVDVVAALAARGQWPTIRPLAGIAEYPVLRADGSVLNEPGYDPRTTLIYEPTCEVQVPTDCSREAAVAAVQELRALVADFPFAEPLHFTAWLATLLALLARPAIAGPVPMTLIDASERGSGKTLLADVIGVICRGKNLARRTAPEDPAEWKKAMLGIAIAADPVVLIDNVTRMLRSDALDAVLTGTSFRERVLGRNEELTLDVRTVFIVTANNAVLSADLIRRAIQTRLEPQSERPDQRGDFAHADLLAYVTEHRARYIAAALTVLRGYFEAGRPKVKMRPMGSYEAWSSVVRAALVWAGEPDVALTQDALREDSDPEHEDTEQLVSAWFESFGSRSVTAAYVLRELADPTLEPSKAALRNAINVTCDSDPGRLPSLRKLGNKLRTMRGRIVDGTIFERSKEHGMHGAEWRTRRLRNDSHDSDDSISNPSREKGGKVYRLQTQSSQSSHSSDDEPDPERQSILDFGGG